MPPPATLDGPAGRAPGYAGARATGDGPPLRRSLLGRATGLSTPRTPRTTRGYPRNAAAAALWHPNGRRGPNPGLPAAVARVKSPPRRPSVEPGERGRDHVSSLGTHGPGLRLSASRASDLAVRGVLPPIAPGRSPVNDLLRYAWCVRWSRGRPRWVGGWDTLLAPDPNAVSVARLRAAFARPAIPHGADTGASGVVPQLGPARGGPRIRLEPTRYSSHEPCKRSPSPSTRGGRGHRRGSHFGKKECGSLGGGTPSRPRGTPAPPRWPKGAPPLRSMQERSRMLAHSLEAVTETSDNELASSPTFQILRREKVSPGTDPVDKR